MILSAGIIVVRQEAGRWLYLFLRAYTYWDFPKGEVETNETPLAAARREVEEETGIADLEFRWGEIFRETDPYRGGSKRARYYLAATSKATVVLGVNPELGRPEHHEYRWLTGEKLEKLAVPRLKPVLAWPGFLV